MRLDLPIELYIAIDHKAVTIAATERDG